MIFNYDASFDYKKAKCLRNYARWKFQWRFKQNLILENTFRVDYLGKYVHGTKATFTSCVTLKMR